MLKSHDAAWVMSKNNPLPGAMVLFCIIFARHIIALDLKSTGTSITVTIFTRVQLPRDRLSLDDRPFLTRDYIP